MGVAQRVFLLIEDSSMDARRVGGPVKPLPHAGLRRVRGTQEAIGYLLGHGIFADRVNYPLPYVILLELHLVPEGGAPFMRWWRDRAPPIVNCIPVVVLPDSAEIEEVMAAYDWGASRDIRKPVDPQMLDLWARHVMQQRARGKMSGGPTRMA